MPRRNPWTISISGWEGENSDADCFPLLLLPARFFPLSVIPAPLSVILAPLSVIPDPDRGSSVVAFHFIREE